MRDSAEILRDPPPPAADARIAYGREPLQFGDLRVPRGDGPFALAVVLHGGYWQATYNLIHMGHLCEALREEGIASWNVEYRCVGVPGGGWPAAGDDVELALAYVRRLPLRHGCRTVLVGHSAGGQLALWAAKRAGVPIVALAPVSDVREVVVRRGPGSAPARFVAAEHFSQASPLELLPLGVPQIVLHGTADEDVPYAMSERYAEAAAGEAELVTLDGCGHFELIDPQAPQFEETLGAARLERQQDPLRPLSPFPPRRGRALGSAGASRDDNSQRESRSPAVCSPRRPAPGRGGVTDALGSCSSWRLRTATLLTRRSSARRCRTGRSARASTLAGERSA